MALTIDKQYADTTVLTEAQLDAAFDSIETKFNTTKIAGDEIQSATITETNLANASVTANKLASDAITSKTITTSTLAGLRVASVSKTADYILDTDEVLAFGDANTVGPFTFTLPTAASAAGRIFEIIKTDSSFNAITIEGDGAETINGAANTTLNTQREAVKLVSDGTNWLVLERRIPSVWTSYTTTNSPAANSSDVAAFWKRVGDSIYLQAYWRYTSTNTANAAFSFTLPSGLTIDTAKTTDQIGNVPLGTALLRDALSQDYSGFVGYSTTTRLDLYIQPSDISYLTGRVSNASSGIPLTVSNNDTIVARTTVPIPITGWNG